ncbi:hypothetical protein ACFQMM_01810 [Saliphagus sp. GCM10025308]
MEFDLLVGPAESTSAHVSGALSGNQISCRMSKSAQSSQSFSGLTITVRASPAHWNSIG